jgi:hypothetical protein
MAGSPSTPLASISHPVFYLFDFLHGIVVNYIGISRSGKAPSDVLSFAQWQRTLQGIITV